MGKGQLTNQKGCGYGLGTVDKPEGMRLWVMDS